MRKMLMMRVKQLKETRREVWKEQFFSCWCHRFLSPLYSSHGDNFLNSCFTRSLLSPFWHGSDVDEMREDSFTPVLINFLVDKMLLSGSLILKVPQENWAWNDCSIRFYKKSLSLSFASHHPPLDALGKGVSFSFSSVMILILLHCVFWTMMVCCVQYLGCCPHNMIIIVIITKHDVERNMFLMDGKNDVKSDEKSTSFSPIIIFMLTLLFESRIMLWCLSDVFCVMIQWENDSEDHNWDNYGY